jgi:hypothetical protein
LEDPASHPVGRETDCYDSLSLHEALVNRPCHELVGFRQLCGEAPQAAPLVKSLDSLPFLAGTETLTQGCKGTGESFMRENRLQRLRELAATVPGKEAVLKQVTAELESREKGLLKADTVPRAQALLQDVIRSMGAANGIDARDMEDWRLNPMANDHGEVSATIGFSCGVEQLVNLLTALANEPELLATNSIQIIGSNDKKKNIQVRLSPERRGVSAC